MDRPVLSLSPLRLRLIASCFAVLVSSVTQMLAASAAIHPGKWTEPQRWGDPSDPFSHAIHLILLPGDGAPYHSRILWWREERTRSGTTKFYGGQWGWTPSPDSNCVAYPASSFTDIPSPPLTGMDPFCAGHTLLDSTYMLLAGGTDPNTNQYGENKARIFRPGSGTSFGTWSIVEPMADWRWYPTTIPLRDARALTLSGQGYPHHRLFGGLQNGTMPGSPTGDQVYRFIPVTDGSWDAPVIPAADGGLRPGIRRAHTFVETFVEAPFQPAIPGFEQAQTLFGGRGSNGTPLNDTWLLKRADNPAGADYTYSWHQVVASSPPAQRSDHSAVVGLSSMIVFGGRNQDGSARDDTYRLREVSGQGLQWVQVDTTGSLTGMPSKRFGHRAVYHGVGPRKMIVFGGRGGDGQTPTDQSVYELQLSSDGLSGVWKKMPEVDLGSVRPAPRFDHAMIYDQVERTHVYQGTTRSGRVAFVHGGQLDGTTYSDSLWALWLFNDGTVGWELRSWGTPGPRARHTMTWDWFQPRAPTADDLRAGRIYLTGGENPSGPADGHLYTFDPWNDPTWWQWTGPGVNFSGHAMVREWAGTAPRSAERYAPYDNWQELTGAHLLQPTYPPAFFVAGATGGASRVLSLDTRDSSRYLDVPPSGTGGNWFSPKAIGFRPLTGVQYRPGKILVAGGLSAGAVSGLARTLDTSNPSNAWQVTGSMKARYFHNLVLLPNGKVLVVGGKDVNTTDAVGNGVREPQIWDPATGAWTDPQTEPLDEQTLRRGYHSTAILLPDGRVLSAAGEFSTDKYYANIYCPPYLFSGTSGSTAATRPVVLASPDTITYGRRFVVQSSEAQTISAACLIRPGATTHAVDMNQRYVPLTIHSRCTGQLTLSMPATQEEAPPGYYMLFVLLGETPSIARWVRLIEPTGLDDADAVVAGTITDLGVGTGYTTAAISWTAPGDDGTCGLAESFDLRRSTSTLHAGNFGGGTPITTPLPGPSGTLHCVEISGLSSCTSYSFAIKTWDGRQWAPISNVVNVSTKCSAQTVYCEESGLYAQGGGEDGGWLAENSLFWETAESSSRELYRLRSTPLPSGGSLRLLKRGKGQAILDEVAVSAVDRDPTYESFPGSDRVFVGTTGSVARVQDASGTEVTTFASGPLDAPYTGSAGAVLTVDLGPAASNLALLIDALGSTPGVAAESTGILIQKPDGASWRTIDHLHPRRTVDAYAVDAQGARTLRLVFLREHRVAALRRLVVARTETPLRLTLDLATHSRLGDVFDAVRSSGGASVTLRSEETLRLAYSAGAAPSGKVRDLYLEVRGSYTALGPSRHDDSAEREVTSRTVPSLAAAYPSPSAGPAHIAFTLPQAGQVSIRIYNVAGRLVRVLLDEIREAGEHEIHWDGRDDAGRQLPSGVFFYRMIAGEWRGDRRIVLLGP